MNAVRCVVVKLGGSLVGDASLRRWLEALQDCDAARWVVVPGGGPFADAVRAAQIACRFDDSVAHAMALLAMDQCAHLLCGLAPRAAPCASRAQFDAAWAASRLPVWLPSAMLGASDDLARSWDVTSDTIAAWLAHRVGARGLLLVKSCPLPAQRQDARMLAESGIVDVGLPDFLRRHGICLDTLRRDQWADLATAVRRLDRRV